MASPSLASQFLSDHSEKLVLNQYWYSEPSIRTLVDEIQEHSAKCAFLSTPSVFFSLTDTRLRDNSTLFDLDELWNTLPNFVRYDFRQPEQVPESLVHTFDMVCIDPPFITEDVWAQYAATVRRLLAPGGKILLSTIPESAEFLTRLLCVHAVNWRPAIPNLIYQYSLFVNYDSERFRWFNPEIDAEAAERQAKEGGDGSETTAVQWTSRKKCTMEGFGSERYQN